ncbi:MAG TPA: DUF3300 domain-containing protein [Terracidiphilus sp.]|jgi:hypothetical protein
MANCRQSISALVCASLVFSSIGLNGCKKEAQAQAPPATYAVPSPDELYQLVAPIALFPDKLLAQVLAAATYPEQVTEAGNWVQQNAALKGPQLMQAVDQQSWDVSVKGLTQFPDVLDQMSKNLSWTSALGDAYFNSPQNVMNAVQVMRQRAQQAGSLKSTPQQNVSVQNEAPSSAPVPASSGDDQQVTVVQPPPQTIVIESSQPNVVYVPSYNPTVVYGAPVAPYPGYSTAAMVTTGLVSFGVGMMVGAAMSGGCCGWGYNSWGCGWNNASVSYNRNTYVSTSNTFSNRSNYNGNTSNINRGNQVNPLNNRAGNGAGNRGGVGDRNGAGGRNGVGDRNGAGGRGGVGDRGGDLGSSPRFDSGRNQPGLGDQGRGDQGRGNQGRGDQAAGGRGNSAGARPSQQPDFGGRNQAAQPRASTNDRQAARGYGDKSSNRAGNNALGNSGQGGNARANSSRGQQSLNGGGNRGGSSASARPSGGANRSAGGGGASRGSGAGSSGRSRGGGGRR